MVAVADDPIRIDFTTTAALQRQLTDLSLAVDNSSTPVRSVSSDLESAAGEFAADLADGAAAFELAWRVALGVLGGGAAVIGNNVGRSQLDFSALDVDYSSNIKL